jgi:uncharacterized membrane protein YhdT
LQQQLRQCANEAVWMTLTLVYRLQPLHICEVELNKFDVLRGTPVWFNKLLKSVQMQHLTSV